MNRLIKIVLVGLFLVNAPSLFAETNVSVFAGYRGGGEFEDSDTGDKLKLAEGETVGFTIDWDYSRNTTLQLFYSRQESQFRSDTAAGDVLFDLDIDYLGFGGAYTWPGKKAVPYLSGTLGITSFRPESGGYGSKSRPHLSFGFGTRIKLGKSVGLKFEARGFGTFFDSSGAAFCGNNGCRVLVASSTLFQYELMAGLNIAF